MSGSIVTWWRKQRVSLIALLISAIAVIGVHVWLDVLPEQDQNTAAIIEADRSAIISGQTLRLGSSQWDEFESPKGSRTLTARLGASGGADSTSCGPFTLTEPSSGRVWLDARSALDVPFDIGERACLEGESFSYDIVAVFLLPKDATGPFALDIPGSDDTVVRFLIEE